jgi:hypothetical protein
MADARDGSWGGNRLALLLLFVKISHVWVDVNWLACHLYRPMDCGCHVQVESRLMGPTLSHCTA